MRSRCVRLGAVVLVLTVVLSGCSGGESREIDLPAKNRSQWTLPLDSYVWPLVDLAGEAQDLLVQECLAQSGFEWKVVPLSEKTRPGESWNDVKRKLFSPQLAAKYGYGNSPEFALSADQEQRMRDAVTANEQLSGPEFDKAYGRCSKRAAAKFGGASGSMPQDLAGGLAAAAYSDAFEASSVKDATKKWVDCMRKVGVPDLPSSPRDMPPASLQSPSGDGVDEVPDLGVQPDVPSQVLRVAVADARCQESSGYADASYQAEWDAQRVALDKNADEISRYARQADEETGAAKKIIAEHAALQ